MSDERSRILVIGPGPAVIGEGAEIDAAASAALRVLSAYGIEAIWAGSTPASLSSQPGLAHRTYLEPRDARALAAIVERERPHAILPIMGGDKALDLALALHDDGTLGRVGVALLGVSADTIRAARDRAVFEAALARAGLVAQAREALAREPDAASWFGVELDIALDEGGYAIASAVESLDAIGVHPGDSVGVSPPTSLGEAAAKAARKAARGAMRAIGLGHGVANVELAVRRTDGEIRVLAVTPRLSRSSALALIATGFPLAVVATELALGSSLDEIGVAAPSFRGTVVRWPRFAFERFPDADAELGATRKSIGESLGRGSTVAEALRRAARGVDDGLAVPRPIREVAGTSDGAKRVLVVGAGPSRIGQGPELAACAAEALVAARELGYEAVFLDSSPESCALATGIADRVLVEPPTLERVLAAYGDVRADGVLLHVGGEAGLRLARDLEEKGARVLGTRPATFARVLEDGERASLLAKLDIAGPAELGSTSMHAATALDVEALCDGARVVVAGVLEHLEPAFVHGGDAAAILPPFTLMPDVVERIEAAVRALAIELAVVGHLAVRVVVKDGRVAVLEIEPRAGRTTMFVTRATGVPLARIATKLMLGKSLDDLGVADPPVPRHVAARERVFPFDRLPGVDPMLGSEMRSTGEVIGLGDTPPRAYAKALRGVGIALARKEGDRSGARDVLLTVTDVDRPAAVEIARRVRAAGFDVAAMGGVRESLAHARVPFRDLGGGSEAEVAAAASEIRQGRIAFAVVTVRGETERSRTRSLRAAALASRAPCFTTVALARLGCAAIEEGDAAYDVRSLGEWYAANEG
jgi:carbamoylphosphate synthase large subunit